MNAKTHIMKNFNPKDYKFDKFGSGSAINIAKTKERKKIILSLFESGLTYQNIADQFEISPARVKRIIHGSKKQKPILTLDPNTNLANLITETIFQKLAIILLKDGPNIRFNYKILRLILSFSDPYFLSQKGRNYIRVVTSKFKDEIIEVYNTLLDKHGEQNVSGWEVHEDLERYSIPKCLVYESKDRDFLLEVFKSKKQVTSSDDVLDLIANIKYEKISRNKAVTHQSVKLSDVKELCDMIDIAKSDDSLKREDYLMLLEQASACLKAMTVYHIAKLANNITQEKSITQEKNKENTPRFWPKPHF